MILQVSLLCLHVLKIIKKQIYSTYIQFRYTNIYTSICNANLVHASFSLILTLPGLVGKDGSNSKDDYLALLIDC